MIEVKNLRIKVRDTILLDEISFSLEKYKIYALIGDNGSGKTTLLRALSSYYPKYSGSILFNKKELRDYKRGEKEGLHAILPQNIPIVDITTESLLSINKKGLEMLSSLGMDYLKERRVSTLSGGEREMVYLAFLLSRDAELYLFDEVEANLDSRYKKKAEGAMIMLKERGKTVITSFHDINRALSLSDEIILINNGKLIFKGDKESFLKGNYAKEYFDLSLKTLHDQSGDEIKMLL